MIHDTWLLSPSSLKELLKALDTLSDFFDTCNFHITNQSERFDTVYNLRNTFHYLKRALYFCDRRFPLDKASMERLSAFYRKDFPRLISKVESERDMPYLPF